MSLSIVTENKLSILLQNNVYPIVLCFIFRFTFAFVSIIFQFTVNHRSKATRQEESNFLDRVINNELLRNLDIDLSYSHVRF